MQTWIAVVALLQRTCEGGFRSCAAVLLVALLCGCNDNEGTDEVTKAPAVMVIDIVELSAADAQAKMARGEFTARQLTQAYLDRIAAIDRTGPALNSVIELNPAALDDADALDAERASGQIRGPLHGVVLLLKDNIDVAGMVNSAGSLALENNRPKQDAFLVARLRAAGAIILGKTNLSEWANFRSTHSTSGWSSRGGQTRNPYVLDRNPCGSSAGTASAIAASLATIGVGTETDGSIICPAAINGLVGLKPTVGVVSRHGIIPISSSQDTAGPMGRTVADVAVLLSALVAADHGNAANDATKAHPGPDFTAFLNAGALAGKRLGLARKSLGFNADVDAAMERAIAALTAAGAIVIDVKIEGYGSWDAAELDVMLYEFKDGLNAYLKAAGVKPASLAELIDWNDAHRDRVMPWFGQELLLMAQAKGSLKDPAYIEARSRARRLAGTDGLLATLAANRIDALIAPSNGPAWVTDLVLGDRSGGGGGAGIAAVAGTPSITVPMGNAHGLPLGLVFMGPADSEAQLIGFAFAFEQATHARTPPKFLPTLPTTPQQAADAHR
jgi:amidase